MTRYHYSGRDAAGQAVGGWMQGASSAAVAERLLADGVVPLKIDSSRFDRRRWSGLMQAELGFGPGDADMIMLCRQMASLLRARVPLARAVLGVRDVTRHPALKRALTRVHESIAAGQDLALAMQQESRVFSRLAVSLVHAGERVGRLDRAFEQIVDHLERERVTRRAVWASLRYPIFVVAAMFVALLVIDSFAMPAFISLFGRLGSELPTATKMLMEITGFVTHVGPFLAAGVALLLVGLRVLPTWPQARAVLDGARLRLPVIGPITRMCVMARFCRSWAMLLDAGQPVLDALAVTAEVADNQAIRGRLMQLRGKLRRGQSLSEAAQSSGIFDSLVVQMLAVGEVSGQTAGLIRDVGEYYEREASYRALRAADLLQPLMLAALGGLVALLAAGVFLPMWSLMDGYN